MAIVSLLVIMRGLKRPGKVLSKASQLILIGASILKFTLSMKSESRVIGYATQLKNGQPKINSNIIAFI